MWPQGPQVCLLHRSHCPHSLCVISSHVPDNTDIHVGIRRIKLGRVPEGVLQEGKGCGETQENSGIRETLRDLGKRMRGGPFAIPPWLPEHLCKHCGVQSKAGAAGLAHTCKTGERRDCQDSAQLKRAQQFKMFSKERSLNEASAHKNLKDLLAESITNLYMGSP